MIGKKLVSAFVVLALAASPVAASAAQPLSLANAPQAREGAAMSEANNMDGEISPIWIAAGAVVLYLGIALIADWWPFDDDEPTSP